MDNPAEVKMNIDTADMEDSSFRRDFYYDVKKAIKENNFSFLLGPRKCGKTVCLKQLLQDYTRAGVKAKYINFKTIDSNAQYKVLGDIYRSLEADEAIIYLLDNITYLENAELNIATMAGEMEDQNNKNTKVLFTGNQSTTVRTWANRAFGGFIEDVYADFLSYPEYLRYEKREDVSEESYLDFLYNMAEFHNIISLKNYLRGCLADAAIANRNTASYIVRSECDLLTENPDMLVSVCYMTLFSLRNHIEYEKLREGNGLTKNIPAYFRAVGKGLSNTDFAEGIRDSFLSKYRQIQCADNETLRQALLFLHRSSFITLTPMANDPENIPDVYEIFVNNADPDITGDLFNRYSITINSPMFYIMILQDILGQCMPGPRNLPREFLGSIVECQTIGLLPSGFELKNAADETGHNDAEAATPVNVADSAAVKFAVSRSQGKVFYLLPDSWKSLHIHRPKVKYDLGSTVKNVPYYEFLYQLDGKEYEETLRIIRQNKLTILTGTENT